METPNSFRTHIGIYGRTNSGKSSLINAMTNQDVSLVSPIKGTTTDPVKKAMEILPLGPVLLIDTAGLDDDTELGSLRIEKTLETLNSIDVGLIVVDSCDGISEFEEKLIDQFKTKDKPFIIVFNKVDLQGERTSNYQYINVSASGKLNIQTLLEMISKLNVKVEKYILKDIVNPNDVVVLVTPIDKAAPKGRIILPQQQVLRELLDIGAIPIVIREFELEATLNIIKQKPNLVITDSQVFGYVNKVLPSDINLTSFSILFARFKGDLDFMLSSIETIKNLRSNDKVLILEGCTHHKTTDDIGTVKIPKWLKEISNDLQIDFKNAKSLDFNNLDDYKVVIMFGACMLNEAEVTSIIKRFKEKNIKVCNYGLFISYSNKILERATKVFKK